MFRIQYIYETWDASLEDKKGILANSIGEIEAAVNSNNIKLTTISQCAEYEDTPFIDSDGNFYRYCYCAPEFDVSYDLYELKRRVRQIGDADIVQFFKSALSELPSWVTAGLICELIKLDSVRDTLQKNGFVKSDSESIKCEVKGRDYLWNELFHDYIDDMLDDAGKRDIVRKLIIDIL